MAFKRGSPFYVFLVVARKTCELGRRLVAGEVRREVELQVIAQVEELDHGAIIDGDAVLAAVFLGKDLFLAMGVDAIGAFGKIVLAKSSEVFAEMLLDGFSISESRRVDSGEAVADACLVGERAAFVARHAHRQN